MAVILHRNDLPEQRPQHRVSGGAEMMESSDQRKPFPGQSVWTLISMISYLQFFWLLLWSIAALATLHAFLGQVVKLMHEVACLRDPGCQPQKWQRQGTVPTNEIYLRQRRSLLRFAYVLKWLRNLAIIQEEEHPGRMTVIHRLTCLHHKVP